MTEVFPGSAVLCLREDGGILHEGCAVFKREDLFEDMADTQEILLDNHLEMVLEEDCDSSNSDFISITCLSQSTRLLHEDHDSLLSDRLSEGCYPQDDHGSQLFDGANAFQSTYEAGEIFKNNTIDSIVHFRESKCSQSPTLYFKDHTKLIKSETAQSGESYSVDNTDNFLTGLSYSDEYYDQTNTKNNVADDAAEGQNKDQQPLLFVSGDGDQVMDEVYIVAEGNSSVTLEILHTPQLPEHSDEDESLKLMRGNLFQLLESSTTGSPRHSGWSSGRGRGGTQADKRRKSTVGRSFSCSVCNKIFSTNYSLGCHMRIHTGETPYHCSVDGCSKKFKMSGDLAKHTRSHTGERPFKCEVCGRGFTTCNILKVHTRVHTGERPYPCTYCTKRFASLTNFRNHMRIHNGEKPFVCAFEGCGRRFTEYSSLYKHKVVHSDRKMFHCNICNKQYRQDTTFRYHMRTVHGTDTCTNCTGCEQCCDSIDRTMLCNDDDGAVESQGETTFLLQANQNWQEAGLRLLQMGVVDDGQMFLLASAAVVDDTQHLTAEEDTDCSLDQQLQ